MVARATARADELSDAELIAGGGGCGAWWRACGPWLAVVGITAYRTAFAAPLATVGLLRSVAGPGWVWVSPTRAA